MDTSAGRWWWRSAHRDPGGRRRVGRRGAALLTNACDTVEPDRGHDGYAKRIPLFVIRETSVRPEGLPEGRYDWYVRRGSMRTFSNSGVRRHLREPAHCARAPDDPSSWLSVGRVAWRYAAMVPVLPLRALQ